MSNAAKFEVPDSGDNGKSYVYNSGSDSHVLTSLAALYQPLDSDLTALAALTTTSFGRGLLELANAAALQTAAGLVIGTDVQAYSAVLAATTASFTTADESKLDGIEAGATADMSAAEILAALLTVDGAGSGLDADLLDGNSSAAFATAGHNHDPTYQPLDSDLSAIAALSTTSFGRALLALADAAALRTAADVGAQAVGGDLTGTVGNAQIAAGAVGATELASDAVTNAKVADDAIGIAELSATGTPSSSTYLRGDNTWATVSASADTGAAPDALTGSPTLLAWYKADALALSDGDAVATWTDSGPNGYNLTQGTSGSRPTYRAASGLNDQPAVQFDGTDDFVRNGSTGAASQTNITVVAVVVPTSNANMRAVDIRGSGYIDLSQNGAQISWQVGPPVSLFVTSKTNVPNALFIMRSNGTKAQAFVNGHLHSYVETGSGAVTPGQIAIGNDNGTGQYWRGLIAEVIVYAAYLSQAQMRQVSRHLANKYGFPLGVITA